MQRYYCEQLAKMPITRALLIVLHCILYHGTETPPLPVIHFSSYCQLCFVSTVVSWNDVALETKHQDSKAAIKFRFEYHCVNRNGELGLS